MLIMNDRSKIALNHKCRQKASHQLVWEVLVARNFPMQVVIYNIKVKGQFPKLRREICDRNDAKWLPDELFIVTFVYLKEHKTVVIWIIVFIFQ